MSKKKPPCSRRAGTAQRADPIFYRARADHNFSHRAVSARVSPRHWGRQLSRVDWVILELSNCRILSLILIVRCSFKQPKLFWDVRPYPSSDYKQSSLLSVFHPWPVASILRPTRGRFCVGNIQRGSEVSTQSHCYYQKTGQLNLVAERHVMSRKGHHGLKGTWKIDPGAPAFLDTHRIQVFHQAPGSFCFNANDYGLQFLLGSTPFIERIL